MTTSKASSTQNKPERPSWIQEMMFVFSGANIRILRECPTDWNKYAGIGATIMFTGMLAALSGGYALFTIFRGEENAVQYAVGFGILWGLVILNIDRFVVASIKKQGNLKGELIQALPRFGLAIVISIVIAKPLEVKIFESRITQQINENKLSKLAEETMLIDSINNLSGLASEINDIASSVNELEVVKQSDPKTPAFAQLIADKNQAEKELAEIRSKNNPLISKERKEIAQIKNNSQYYRPQYDDENNIIGNEITKQGNDLIAARRANINRYNGQINSVQRKVQAIEAEIKQARDEHRKAVQEQIDAKTQARLQKEKDKIVADSIANKQVNESRDIKEKAYTNNFITQLEAMDDLTKNNKTLWWTSTMIALLFIVIETAPILAKLLSHRGPYDDLLESHEHKVSVRSKLNISEINLEINELLKGAEHRAKQLDQLQSDNNKAKLDKDHQIYLNTIEIIAEKQEDLAKIAINQWYEVEKQKLEQQNSIVKTLELSSTAWRERSNKAKAAIYLFHPNGNLEIQQSNSSNAINRLIVKPPTPQMGTWRHDTQQQTLAIDVNGKNTLYQVIHFSHNKLEIMKEEDQSRIVFEHISYTPPQQSLHP